MSVSTLRSIVDILDVAHRDNSDWDAAKPLYKKAAKTAKETWAPLKSIMGWTHLIPAPTQVLTICLSSGGELRAWAEELLKEQPREVWFEDGDPVVVKDGVYGVFHGAGAHRVAIGAGKGKVDVYDLPARTLASSLKLDGLKHLRFVDTDTVRALLKDGKLVEQKAGEKKARVVSEFGDCVDGCVGDRHVAVVKEVVDDNGDASYSVVVDNGAAVALAGVKACVGVSVIGDAVYVNVVDKDGLGGFARVEGGAVSFTWLPRFPSGGTAPDIAENAHQFVVVDGVTFVVTWADRGASARRWLRLPDLVEDARFGHDFDSVDVCGGAVWSAHGDRVQNGARTSPLGFEGRCWSVVAVADDDVTALVIDSKDKLWLRRFRRYAAA